MLAQLLVKVLISIYSVHERRCEKNSGGWRSLRVKLTSGYCWGRIRTKALIGFWTIIKQNLHQNNIYFAVQSLHMYITYIYFIFHPPILSKLAPNFCKWGLIPQTHAPFLLHRPWQCVSQITYRFYAPQLYRQVLLRRVLAMGILSVCLSVHHGPVQKQPSDIETPGLHYMIA